MDSPVAGNVDPCCRSVNSPVFLLICLPVTDPSTWLDVYKYWLDGSSTMHTGPDPTGYGLLVPPSGIGDSLLDVGSMVNAEMELPAAALEFVVDWFNT